MSDPGPASIPDGSALTRVLVDVVAQEAAEVDRLPRFPRSGIIALAEAGLLALPGASDGEPGGTLAVGARVVAELARYCGSTAAVVLTHYAASSVLHASGVPSVRDDVTGGEMLATLALFGDGPPWAPAGKASHYVGGMRLDGSASGVVSAGQADVYVWATTAAGVGGGSSLWMLPDGTPGLRVTGAYEAVGLRGAAIAPMTSLGVTVPVELMLGADGAGREAVVATALPWLLVCSAALLVGLADVVLDAAAGLAGGPRAPAVGAPAGPEALAAVGRVAARVGAASALVEAAAAAWDARRAAALRQAAEARLAADEAVRGAVDLAVEAVGMAPAPAEAPLERQLRDARTALTLAPGALATADLAGRLASGVAAFPQVPGHRGT